MSTMRSLSVGLLIAVGACGEANERATSRDTGMAGMEGMPGTVTSGSPPMMADMEAHLSTMGQKTADSMKVMLPTHRQRVANLIAQLDREMRDMNMTGTAAWSATLDSLRQDLRVMPDLSSPSLRDFMPAHSQRVRRIIEMHRSMMASMGH